jgi:hypothetical protein
MGLSEKMHPRWVSRDEEQTLTGQTEVRMAGEPGHTGTCHSSGCGSSGGAPA